MNAIEEGLNDDGGAAVKEDSAAAIPKAAFQILNNNYNEKSWACCSHSSSWIDTALT